MMPQEIHYIACGQFTSRDSSWVHPQRRISSLECILVTKGEVYILEEQECFCLKEGDALFLEPNRLHVGYEASSSKVSFFWLHMTPFAIEERETPKKHFSLCEPYSVSLLCRQLLHYSSQSYPQHVCDALLSVLLAELTHQSHEGNDAAAPLAIRVREWVRINSDRRLDVGQIADHFGYNSDYLCRLIRANYGCSLKGLIAECKMNDIKNQLLNTDYTLLQIASNLGFADYKQFLKFFRYHQGMTPTEFRAVYYSTHTNNR